MSILAAPISYNAPPQSWMNSVRGFNTVKILIWAGLSLNTRKGYQTGIRSYIYWASYVGATAWPATSDLLEEWAANRIMGSTIAKQGQVQPDTVASYLSAIRSWHIDHEYSLQPFETLRMKLLLQGERSFFPAIKGTRLPITKANLCTITASPPTTLNELNLDTDFKVAWAGFMRLGEIIYTEAEKRNVSFEDLHLTRCDITFSENDQYATLRLKQSKTDTNHTGVLIMLAATASPSCPVKALRSLFTHDPQPPSSPLFTCNNSSFTRRYVINQLRQRLQIANIPALLYSGHSFRRGAAQHASDNGMLDEDIQKLGRWSSETFGLYFTTSAQTLFNLNMNLQTGRPVALPRARLFSSFFLNLHFGHTSACAGFSSLIKFREASKTRTHTLWAKSLLTY